MCTGWGTLTDKQTDRPWVSKMLNNPWENLADSSSPFLYTNTGTVWLQAGSDVSNKQIYIMIMYYVWFFPISVKFWSVRKIYFVVYTINFYWDGLYYNTPCCTYRNTEIKWLETFITFFLFPYYINYYYILLSLNIQLTMSEL